MRQQEIANSVAVELALCFIGRMNTAAPLLAIDLDERGAAVIAKLEAITV